MIAKTESACLIGMEAARVHVEVNLAKGMPSFSIVGLPDASVREAKDRVVAAIRNTGLEIRSRRSPFRERRLGSLGSRAVSSILRRSRGKRWPNVRWRSRRPVGIIFL